MHCSKKQLYSIASARASRIGDNGSGQRLRHLEIDLAICSSSAINSKRG